MPKSEVEHLMAALKIPIISEQDDYLTKIASQGVPKNTRMQLERLGSLVPQPTEIPQFHSSISRTTAILTDSTEKFMVKNTLGELNSTYDKFRP